VIQLLYDFLFQIAKGYRIPVVKTFVKVLYVESQISAKESNSDYYSKIEYGSNIYEDKRKQHIPKPNPAPKKKSAPAFNPELMGGDLTEEEMMQLAMEMSLEAEKQQEQ